MSVNNPAGKAMPRHRKISLTAGLLYLLTFVSIPSLARFLSASGIVAGPVLITGYLIVMFGLAEQHNPAIGLFAIPAGLFELALGFWLVAKGSNAKAVSALDKENS